MSSKRYSEGFKIEGIMTNRLSAFRQQAGCAGRLTKMLALEFKDKKLIGNLEK